MPSGKIVEPYFMVELPDSVVITAITPENEILLVEQYRHPIGELFIELPGGFIDPGESKEKAISRELTEETGYAVAELKYLGKTYGNPGVLNNCTYLFFATGCKKTGDQTPDPNEEIRIILRPADEVKKMITRGEFKQSLHEICLRRALDFLQQL